MNDIEYRYPIVGDKTLSLKKRETTLLLNNYDKLMTYIKDNLDLRTIPGFDTDKNGIHGIGLMIKADDTLGLDADSQFQFSDGELISNVLLCAEGSMKIGDAKHLGDLANGYFKFDHIDEWYFPHPYLEHITVTGADVIAENNVFNKDWTDYSNNVNTYGWSSFTTKKCFYKRIGNLVMCQFNFSGESNKYGTYFTLPYPISMRRTYNKLIYDTAYVDDQLIYWYKTFVMEDDLQGHFAIYSYDNGEIGIGRGLIFASDSTQWFPGTETFVTTNYDFVLFSSASNTQWNNSGTKTAIGSFFYQCE